MYQSVISDTVVRNNDTVGIIAAIYSWRQTTRFDIWRLKQYFDRVMLKH